MLFYGDAMTSTTSNIAFGNAHSSVQANNIHGSVHIGPDNTLDRLPRAEDAPFNSYARQHEDVCLPNTRVDLLQEIYAWADGQDERCIFWLSGLAGTGKSTIARTVAERYYANQRLAASFFFSRGRGDVSHARMLVTSIAVQLADNVPASRHYIRDAIAERSNIARLSLRDQWRHLVLSPLSRLCEAGSYIIVVDALDECDSDSDIRLIVQLLAEVRPLLTSVQLRVFVTSRPEVPIRHGFGQMADSKHKDVVLHNLSPSVVDHDIEIYLKQWLSVIAKSQYYADDWPGAETIRQLVQSACGLFIWAATAYRFIQEGGQLADDRLHIVLKDSAVTDNLSQDSSSGEDSCINDQRAILPEKQLDSIYLTVLKRPVRRYRKHEREKWCASMKGILGAIVLLYLPLSATSLAQLLVISTEEVYRTLNELHSILDIPTRPTDHVRLHHPSFRDFLLNKDRCTNSNLWVDERQAHTALADKCIQLLSSLLKEDICGVGNFGARAAEIDRKQLEHCIPPEMQYACLYWTNHLAKGSVQLHDNDEVYDFLKEHYLHWLEALSWMAKISEGIYAISSLESIALASDCPTLSRFIHDMKRFVLHSRSPIELAPLQVYSSALVFAPRNSLVKRQFANHLTQWMKSPPQVDGDWGACLQTLEGHNDKIMSVAFSHDSLRLASVSYDGTVKIWDVRSGKCLQKFEVYNSLVAFSHDLTRLVSASPDDTVKVWDINSSVCLHTLEGHSSVDLIAFSHDSMQLALASRNETIEIWDTSRYICQHKSKLCNDSFRFKAFSHNLTQLASASTSKTGTIKIWDVSSGTCLRTLNGHSDFVSSMAFSQDSAWLATGSNDNTAKIWDVSSGACLRTLKGHGSWVISVGLSHDLKQLASASWDETVKIWDTRNSACLQTDEGHSGSLSSVAFSHDSMQLASASEDGTIKIWGISSSVCPQTRGDHENNLNSVTFSHDSMQQILDTSSCNCWQYEYDSHMSDNAENSTIFPHGLKWMASGLHDGTIKFEDRRSGVRLRTLEGHHGPIKRLVLSHDSKWLASTSQDKSIKIWDTSNGVCIQTLKSDSHYSVGSIAFSHDSALLASALETGTVQIWDISNGACLKTVKNHHRFIVKVTFSNESIRLASTSVDRTVTIWDTNSGARLLSFRTCNLYFLSNDFAVLQFREAEKFQPLIHCSINISADRTWITRHDEEWLWLPVEYRPGHLVISEECIAVTTPLGKTWTCHFV